MVRVEVVEAMRRLDELRLSDDERNAVLEADRRLKERFPVRQLLIFGSVARGDAGEDSDLDLLALTSERLSHSEKHEAYDEIFEINLKHDTLLSLLCVDEASWHHGFISMMAIHDDVQRDGVIV